MSLYNSISELKAFLNERGFSMQKKFGQNFMIDPNVRQQIIDQAAIEQGMVVWEIGPGIGALTHHLIDLDVELVLFEIDHGFISILESLLPKSLNYKIVQGDVLKTWKNLGVDKHPQVILGNLPYYSASSIISSFLEDSLIKAKMIFTVQKEGAERMIAEVGSKNYSSFSVFCQILAEIRYISTLPAHIFWPAPDVQSALVSLEKTKENNLDPKRLSVLLQSCFRSRRKTLQNNLKSSEAVKLWDKVTILEAFQSQGIQPGQRAEEIKPQIFRAVFREIESIGY